MDENRLTGLALLHTHKDININVDIINIFTNGKKKLENYYCNIYLCLILN